MWRQDAFALTSGDSIAILSYMVRVSLVVVVALSLLIGPAGCQNEPRRQQPTWDGVKIGELAAPPQDRLPPPQFIATARIDVHLMELPADNVDRLDKLWQALSVGPVRMSSYNAFSENSFRIRFGRAEMLGKIEDLLAEADGQRAGTISMTVSDNETSDLPIADLPVARQIAFVGNNLSRQAVSVGPGVLVLRMTAQPIPGARGVRKIIAYPTYTIPLKSAIAELQSRTRKHDFYFEPAAFACQMGPGDLVVLGPEEYTGERVTLGGLFFNKPDGTLFFNPTKRTPPEHKTAVRVYILLCTDVSG